MKLSLGSALKSRNCEPRCLDLADDDTHGVTLLRIPPLWKLPSSCRSQTLFWPNCAWTQPLSAISALNSNPRTLAPLGRLPRGCWQGRKGLLAATKPLRLQESGGGGGIPRGLQASLKVLRIAGETGGSRGNSWRSPNHAKPRETPHHESKPSVSAAPRHSNRLGLSG